MEAVRLAETGIGGHLEGLVIAFAVNRLEAKLAKFSGDEGPRLFEFRAARGATLELLGSEKLDVVQVGVRIDSCGGAGCDPADKENGGQEPILPLFHPGTQSFGVLLGLLPFRRVEQRAWCGRGLL